MSDEVTLRELMDLRLQNIEKELAQLREVVTGDLATLKTRQERTEDRLLILENTLTTYRYIGGLIVAVVMAIVVAWLRGVLGL